MEKLQRQLSHPTAVSRRRGSSDCDRACAEGAHLPIGADECAGVCGRAFAVQRGAGNLSEFRAKGKTVCEQRDLEICAGRIADRDGKVLSVSVPGCGKQCENRFFRSDAPRYADDTVHRFEGDHCGRL